MIRTAHPDKLKADLTFSFRINLEHKIKSSPSPSIDRTFKAIFEMPKTPNSQLLTKICKHQYRNPIFLARQWQLDLAERKYSSRADLSRKLGVSRARVTQVLNLTQLPEDVIEKLYAMVIPFQNQ
jgi:hypothetical protein